MRREAEVTGRRVWGEEGLWGGGKGEGVSEVRGTGNKKWEEEGRSKGSEGEDQNGRE